MGAEGWWGTSDADRVRMAVAFGSGHLFIHGGGYTLYYAGGSKVIGHDLDAMKTRCADFGLPIIDTRCLNSAVAYRLAVGVPEVAGLQPSYPPPLNPEDEAPLREVAAIYRAPGVEVLNLPNG